MANARCAPIDLGVGAGAGCPTIALPRLRVRLRLNGRKTLVADPLESTREQLRPRSGKDRERERRASQAVPWAKSWLAKSFFW